MDQNREPQPDPIAALDDPHVVFGLLLQISTRLEIVGNSFLDGLTTKQWFFMAALRFYFTEPPTLGELASRMGSSHQNVKQLAMKLEKKGYIHLDRDAQDKRVLRILTTKKAKQYEQEHTNRNESFIQLLLQPLNEETIHTLRRGLLVLDEALRYYQEHERFQNGTPEAPLK